MTKKTQHPARKNNNKFSRLMENDLVCLSKWRWSTIHLQQGTTRSCHRTNEDRFDPEDLDNFHNTPLKLDTRFDMLNGKWPGKGCEYCKRIEDAGGVSDRLMFNRDSRKTNIPPELFKNNKTIKVTPTLIEISLGNLCNMSCIYCGPAYSSVWEAEMLKFPDSGFRFEENLFSPEQYKRVIEKFFDWLDRNIENLRDIHILGGEPTLQPEFIRLIDFFENNKKRIKLDTFVIMTNLKVSKAKLENIASRLDHLTKLGCIKSVFMYPSIDCWGPEQEYIRTGINIKQFEENFAFLVKNYPNIGLQTHSVMTSLSMSTLPNLMNLVNHYNQHRTENKIQTNWNFVSCYEQFHPGWFPNGFFDEYFDRAIDLIDSKDGKAIMKGLKDTANSMPYDPSQIAHLKSDLDKLDNRRNTNWRKTFPWLAEFDETKER